MENSNVNMNEFVEFDISLIEYNLSLSYEERLLQHQEALNIIYEIEKAREALDEKFK